MRDFAFTLVLTLLGGANVLAAPVEPQSTENLEDIYSSWINKIRPTHSRHNSSSHRTSVDAYPLSIRSHEADEHNVKTKTETQVITEDCSATDDMVQTTIVELVPSTRILEYTPSYTKTKTVVRTVLYDVTETASTKSTHKPKHTKHTWTETVTTPSSTTSKSKKHSKSSKTTVSPPPSSSAPSSRSSKKEVVVTTSEVIEVVTIGTSEVVETMTLTEGDSRLSTMTQTSSSTSSSSSQSWPSYLTILSKFPPIPLPTYSADAVVGDVEDMATSNASPLSTSLRTIHHYSTTMTRITPDALHYTTTPARLFVAETQGADDVAENLSARDDDDDPDHFYKKYRKPDKAMSKRMSRWSRHHSIQMEKQSSYKHKVWIKSLEKAVKAADKAMKTHKYDHDDRDEQVASVGMVARDTAMETPKPADVVITVTTTVLPIQNETYSISFRTVHASKTGSAKNATITSPSKTHSKVVSKSSSSKTSKTSSGSSSNTTSPPALEMDADAMTTSKYLFCTTPPCLGERQKPASTKTTFEAVASTIRELNSSAESQTDVPTYSHICIHPSTVMDNNGM
ncbi:hypothetical protein QM012_008294 [Aureobasidium pullulans]|uniref:Uncharacterized protein n=1 Tax=Aureobasidium pullulans TaxID=5580 RepID=A0ABR0TJW6_AURPU